MANERIRCTVDTCRFWSSGNRCEADTIMVANDADQAGGRLEAGVAGGGQANDASQTKCDTFRHRR